jgi:hypothetical protein
MTMTESVVEKAALAWLYSIDWSVRHGAEIERGKPAAEREDYHKVFLEARLRDALLPKLISGELRVKQLEKLIEEVV